MFEPSVKFSSIRGRFYGSCGVLKNTECVNLHVHKMGKTGKLTFPIKKLQLKVKC